MGTNSRTRGGQPGNRNALKHGMYSVHFTPAECDSIEAAMGEGIDEEIVLLRVVIKRLFSLGQGVQTMDDATCQLNAIGAACTRLAGLLRVKTLMGAGNEASVFLDALSEVNKELGMK